MKRALKYFLAVVLCLVVVWTIKIVIKEKTGKTPEASYVIPRQVRYSFTVTNKTNQLVKNGQVWAYAPVKQTAAQLCKHIEASHPYQLVQDSLGNQVLHFTFEKLPPFATKTVSIKADLLLSDSPNPLALHDKEIFLHPEKYVESDHPDMISKSKTLKTPESIFDFVAGHIAYSGYLKNDRGALYALFQKKGDCTEFMHLFTALCRAGNIPARGMGGYICTCNTVLKPGSYHNWSEYYKDNIWKIADSQNRVFNKDYSNYVAMRVISESSDSTMKGFDRFRVKGEGIKVKMNG